MSKQSQGWGPGGAAPEKISEKMVSYELFSSNLSIEIANNRNSHKPATYKII